MISNAGRRSPSPALTRHDVPEARAARSGIAILLITIVGASGCASLNTSDSFVARWGMRSAGALGGFVLHEACHLALGAALGADIGASVRGGSLRLEFSGLSRNENQVVAIAGNACTGLASEMIVDMGKHKNNNLAWGVAAFHAINAFGYAFSSHGDAEYWKGSGGSATSWQVINATHSSRIGAQLAWDSDFGDYLKSRWRIGPPVLAPDLPPVSASSDEKPSVGSELVLGTTEAGSEPNETFLSSTVPATLDVRAD